MPASSNSTEADAVEAAFVQRVQTLYQHLATNLTDSPNSERKAVEAFKKGLMIARRARELALEAIEERPTTTVVVARGAVKPRKAKGARKYRA
jgi:hypothetical protein